MRFVNSIAAVIAAPTLFAAASFAASAPVNAPESPSSIASMYVADFVSTAAFGYAMNDMGDVIGTSYTDPGCGPWCLPPIDTVVWRGGVRTVLPTVPGLSGITVTGINSQGWIAGSAGISGTTTHAVVWQPVGAGYVAIDIGNLPGKTASYAIGIDDLGRAVGWSASSMIGGGAAPFVWTQAGGIVDLSLQGFPLDPPTVLSPGGSVATAFYWYKLGVPGSTVVMPAPPAGWRGPGAAGAINDAGDQGRFLSLTGDPQNLGYPFRFSSGGTWQQIGFAGSGNLSSYGIGGINAAQDITATVLSAGMVASGPNGLLQSVPLSPAYAGASLSGIGDINASGQILGSVMIGRSPRVMRLAPATPCTSNCIKINKLQMLGKFVQDPAHPGQCFQNGIMYNKVQAKITVTNESGTPLSGVLVNGRFLDNYWTNKPVSATTNALGVVQFLNKGPCGVGTVSFLVDKATLGTRTFDRTTGVVAGEVIPQ